MSNPAPPSVSKAAASSGVVATRWWWVRHAPVREDGGCIYGQKDLGCDTSDRVVFEAVGKILPRDAVWYASSLKRTHQTADAIWAAGFPKPAAMPHEAAFAEQHLGEWQGMDRAAFLASRPTGSHWFADIDEPAPGGESFMDLYNRVRGAIERINAEHAGQDAIAEAHARRRRTKQRRAARRGRNRGGAWGHHQGGDRVGPRRSAGERPRLRHRQ